jgi:hypothetical protein
MSLVTRLSRTVHSLARLFGRPRNGHTNFGRRIPKEQQQKWKDWQKNHRTPGERFVPLVRPKFIPAAEATYLQPDENIVGIVLNDEAKAYPTQILAFRHLVQDWVGGEPILISYCLRCSSSIGYRPVVDGVERHFLMHSLRDNTFVITDRETRTVWSQLTGAALEGPDAGKQLDQVQVFQMAWQQWREMHPGTLALDPAGDFDWTYFRHRMGEENAGVRGRVPSGNGKTLAPHSMGLGVQLDGAALFFPFEKMAASGIAHAKLNGESTVTVFYDVRSRGCGAYRATEDMVRSGPGQWQDLRSRSTWNIEGVCTAGPRAGERLVFVPSCPVQWHAWAKHHPQTEVWNDAVDFDLSQNHRVSGGPPNRRVDPAAALS